MAGTINVFLLVFRDLGTGAALVQREELREELTSSVFYVNCLLGILLTAIAYFGSPLAAAFFREPQLIPVMQALSFTFFTSSLAVVQSALLDRALAFNKVAAVELIGALAGTTTGVSLAVSGFGVWSLVSATLVNSVTTTTGLWIVCPWRPKLLFDMEAIRSIARYTMNLSGATLVNYFARNADNLIIGRFLGSTALGYYQMAYNIMLYPLQNVSFTLGRVMMPAISKLQNDHPRFRSVYFRANATIALLTFPMMLGLMVIVRPFFLTVLGPQWLPVVPLLAIFCPIGLVQSIITNVGGIYRAKARTDLMFKWGSIATVLYVASFFAGIPWGIVGVAACYAIVVIGLVYPLLRIPFRLIELPVGEFLKGLLPVLLASGAMAAVVLFVRIGLDSLGLRPVVELLILVAIGIAGYILALRWFQPRVIWGVIDLLSSMGKQRVSALIQRMVGHRRAPVVAGI